MRYPTRYDHLGYGWLDPIPQGYHPGVDFNYGSSNQDEGQEVVSIADGLVAYASYSDGWGNHAIIYHPQYGVYSHYAHLQGLKVCAGMNIKEGQLVGLLGHTGGDWAPHLHFEIRLKDFSPNKYVTGLTLEQIKQNYADPFDWINKRIKEEKDKLTPKDKPMKLIKNSASNKVYAIGNDNKKHWIFNEETFNAGKLMGLWTDEISVMSDDPYAEGNTIMLVAHP